MLALDHQLKWTIPIRAAAAAAVTTVTVVMTAGPALGHHRR
jgi:hypothetical protein